MAASPIDADEQPVLRLTTFQPAEAWHDLDSRLRELMPGFATQAGLDSVWVGRRGPGDRDDRVIVSVWASCREQAAAVTIPEMLEAAGPSGPAIIGARTELMPIHFRLRFTRDRPMRIVRVFRGITHPGELEPYLEEVREGATMDGVRLEGPGALLSALDGAGGFVTASLWPDWPSIELATGGDVRHPLVTRGSARLISGEPAHFEAIAILDGPRAEAAHPSAPGD